ncbi:MAG: 3-hydroxyacyl-CoA dehydrogenase/enoyl-CoA hydratase family protein [Deltaproteobacteria bacterium]|nr:3-hydroxyacyl-CoA dehydrogenase/enoyl-CoA hydratase family protein [Deltaproteobacteria bacterium]
MVQPIKRVAILGAGVMGSGIAAHLASAGIPSLMLDIVLKDSGDDRNKLSRGGKEAALKSKPALFLTSRDADLIEVGNFEDDFARIKDYDWIIEVVKEDLDIKRVVFQRVDQHRRPGSVVTSNTSGLALVKMAAGRSDDFRRHFLVTHFFNPVRYMKLLELVIGPETDPEVAKYMTDFGADVLGKGIVFAKDTPNFVANRIGIFAMMSTLRAMEKLGLSIEDVDAICGPPMGKPKSAVFRTADIVGLDTIVHVSRNCYDALPNDEMRDVFKIPPYLDKMIEKGILGQKVKGGFFKKFGKDIQSLDLATLEYRPQQKTKYASIGAVKGLEDVGQKIKKLCSADDKAGQLAWMITAATLNDSARRLGEIADDIVNIDNGMRWGFNWELGPFQTWDALGVKETALRMEQEGIEVAPQVRDLLKSGKDSFYGGTPGGPTYFDYGANQGKGEYLPVPQPPKQILIAALREGKRVVFENPGATMFDIGDGVGLLQFHTKMNAVDTDIIAGIHQAVDRAERDFHGLVVGNEDPTVFSAGANLFAIMVAIGQKKWDDLDRMIASFQAANQRMRYADVPVVAAPAGLALGGGAEMVLAAPFVRAHCELYIGLVEVGVGVIPAGGGCMNMLKRWMAGIPDDASYDPIPMIKQAFMTIGLANVATSAEEAREAKFLLPQDGVTLRRENLIHDAKQVALGMWKAGYRRPRPATFRLPGKSGGAMFEWFVYNLKAGHQASEHDEKVMKHLTRILCGGDTSQYARVSEQHILDLEREAFLSLCGEPKSQERMQYMLMNNKPLRN